MNSKIQNKKIAILGSSPVMLILFYLLKKNNSVFIFDDNELIGGAWKKKFYKNRLMNVYSNVVLPTNNKEYEKQQKINLLLIKTKIGIKIKRTKKIFHVIFKPKNYFNYDFNYFYKKIKNQSKNIINEKVKKIEILENKKVRLNNNYLFDKVFFPSFFGINHFYNEGKKIDIKFKLIESQHISIIAEKINQRLFYSDFYDHAFDRVNTYRHKNFFNLTARISKSLKKTKLEYLKKRITESFPSIIVKKFFINKYKNYYRNNAQCAELKLKLKKKNIIYVDTTSFIIGVSQIINYIRRY